MRVVTDEASRMRELEGVDEIRVHGCHVFFQADGWTGTMPRDRQKTMSLHVSLEPGEDCFLARWSDGTRDCMTRVPRGSLALHVSEGGLVLLTVSNPELPLDFTGVFQERWLPLVLTAVRSACSVQEGEDG